MTCQCQNHGHNLPNSSAIWLTVTSVYNSKMFLYEDAAFPTQKVSKSVPFRSEGAVVVVYVCLSVTTWTVARQAALSMGFSIQEYGSE